MTQTGGCQCGKIRYRINSGPYAVYACHCPECQKQSASAFGLSMPVPAAALELTGETGHWERATDSGRATRCFFCPGCGTRLYHRSNSASAFVTMKAGTLDDTADISPVAHLWTSRKQPWVKLDPEVPVYATQPEDLRAWRAKLMEGRV